MEIKIDTSKDDVEHIKHIITFLQNFVNKPSNTIQASAPSTQETGVGGMFGMFNQDSANNVQENKSSPAPSEGIFGMFNTPETEKGTQNTDTTYGSGSSANDLLNDSSLDDDDDTESTNNEQKIEIIPY